MTWHVPITFAVDDLIDETMMNQQVRDNIAHLGGMKFAEVALSALASGVSAARIAVGSYTGNGGTTKAITGAGFQPKYVVLWAKTAGSWLVSKTSQDGLYSRVADNNYEVDHIISIDADGFTVGDGTGASRGNITNYNAIGYAWIAFG
ncbi:MAG TPA: hypothetical protein VHP83_21380 [Aggregatilineaceae bacterium]|nr:hypothetical protein [Aggregatilineaceae bacterium]